MALAINDLLKITSEFEQGSNTGMMVSMWRVSQMDVPSTYDVLAEGFQFTLMVSGGVNDIIHTSAKAVRTVVDSLTKPLEYGEFVGDDVGSAGGEPMASFVSLSIKQTVESRLTRAGYKRVPFISESVLNGNDFAGSLALQGQLEDFFGLNASITYTPTEGDPIDIVLVPVVIGRTLNSEVPPFYELDLAKINPVVGASVQGATSQNSRKP